MSAQGDVGRIQRELEALYRKQGDESKKEAYIAEKITSARASASRATSVSSAKSKLAEAARFEREVASVHKKKADIARSIATTTAKLHKAQQRAIAEQAEGYRRAIESLKRQQVASHRQQQRSLLEMTAGVSRTTPTEPSDVEYDAFISHASEDKDDLARPLADALIGAGFRIWFDELQLTIGDSLRRSIDRGLSSARFGIVVLSPSFFAKNWPQYELDGLVAREMEGVKVILPLWHRVSKNDVLKYSPSLADKLALNTATHTIEELVAQLVPALKR